MSRRAGLFRASRWLTRRELRILCYHGSAMGTEVDFLPELFIHPDTFDSRLAYLKERRYAVLGLDEAVRRLEDGTLPDDSVVLTIDDGFYGTFRHAVPSAIRHGLPATVYVTTYYAERQNPIFRLLLQYVFWATRERFLRLDALALEGFGGEVDLRADGEPRRLVWRIIDHAESRLDEPSRLALAKRAAAALRVDLRPILELRLLGLMTPQEIAQAARLGIDIQLHTHRHRFPEDEAAAAREVRDNRAVLEPLVGKRLVHLCYPSGVWAPHHFRWLEREGIQSATTCEVGFARRGDHPLSLKRVFDGSHVTQVQFEAEVSGYLELIRRGRSALRGLLRRAARPATPARTPAPAAAAAA